MSFANYVNRGENSMTGYEILKQYRDMHEVTHTKQLNTFIRKYVPAWNDFSVDDTPWCAAILNATECAAGNAGTGKLNARSFLNYGNKIDIKNAKKGDIVIFTRGGSTWQGHVAYLDGFEEGAGGRILVRTFGGNQSNKVCISYYPKERLIGIRRA